MRVSRSLLPMKKLLLVATALSSSLWMELQAMEGAEQEEASTSSIPSSWKGVPSAPAISELQQPLSSSKGRDNEAEERIHRAPKPLDLVKPRLILSIDGGGIRGVLPAEILKYLENEILAEVRKHTPVDAPALPPECLGDMCSLIAGTSTGGIIALGMRSRSQMHVPDMKPGMQGLIDLYEQQGHIIFTRAQKGFIKGMISPLYASKYTADPLEEILYKYFGDLTLRDLQASTLVTTYDVLNELLYLFNSEQARTKPEHNYKLRYAARATSAGPTYFPAVKIANEEGQPKTCIDGGVTANNPTLHAYLEGQKLYPKDKFYILSLGCGIPSLFTPENRQGGGLLHWAGDIFPVVSNSASRMTEDLMSRSTQLRGDEYVRIQFDLDQRVAAMDATQPRHIQHLKSYAAKVIDDKNSTVHKVRDFILNMLEANRWSVYLNIASQIEEQKQAGKERLDLSNIHLSDRSLWEVKKTLLETDHPFRKLNLKGNALSPYMVSCLGELTMLTELDLRNTGLSQDLFKVLKKSLLSLDHLTTLDLRENLLLKEAEASEILDLITRNNLPNFYDLSLDEEIYYNVGHYLERTNNFEQAVWFYEKGKTPVTQLALAELYFKASHPGEQKQQEYFIKGLSLCQPLSDRGEKEAQHIMGSLMEKALNFPAIKQNLQDHHLLNPTDNLYQKASHYYKLAADQEHKRSAFLLAEFYYTGKVIPVFSGKGRSGLDIYRVKEALKYYQIAAKAGSQSAQGKAKEVEAALKRLEAETAAAHKAG